MIIQLEGPATGNVEAAQRSLEALAHQWGYDIAQSPDGALPAATSHEENRKAIDPVSVAAAVLSIPSAALAVADLDSAAVYFGIETDRSAPLEDRFRECSAALRAMPSKEPV